MAFSLRKIVDHPLLAPLVEPFKMGGQFFVGIAYRHATAFIDGHKKAAQNGAFFPATFMAGYMSIFRVYDGPETFGPGGIDSGRSWGSRFASLSVFLGGATGFVYAGSVLAQGMSTLGIIGTVAGVTAASAFAAPLAMFGGMMAAAGVFGSALGVLKGFGELEYYLTYGRQEYAAKKNQQAAPASPAPAWTPPAVQSPAADPALDLNAIKTLSPEAQMKKLRDEFPEAFKNDDLKKIDAAAHTGAGIERETAPVPDIKKKPFTPKVR